MTLKQIRGFIKAYMRDKALTQMSFIIGVALGSQGDKKALNKTVKDIEAGIKKIDEFDF